MIVIGIVPPLAVGLLHWEDFSIALTEGVLLDNWEALLETRSEIGAKGDHLNDDQRLRLANSDAIIRKNLVPLLRKLGRYDYYQRLSEKRERMHWWYFLR